MTKCPKCNSEIADNAQFCPFCGADLIKVELQTQGNKNENSSKISYYAIMTFTISIFVLPIIVIAWEALTGTDESQNLAMEIIEIIMIIIAIINCKKIKNLVLKVARWLLDFSTTLDALMGVIILITGISVCQDGYINYWWFVLGAFLYTLIALVKDYALYLLVDIRDSLKVLADKAKNEKENL